MLARHIQILTPGFLDEVGCPLINIHHRSYRRSSGPPPFGEPKERGLKLVGATAHYATANLDEGPIIEQDVVRVDHRHSVDDLTRLGADVERAVLWHCEDRIIRYGNQTIVFWSGPSRWANASTALRQAGGACLAAARSRMYE